MQRESESVVVVRRTDVGVAVAVGVAAVASAAPCAARRRPKKSSVIQSAERGPKGIRRRHRLSWSNSGAVYGLGEPCLFARQLYSLAGFLAVDLHWAADLDSSGTVVGILGTCLPLARVPVSVPWGMAMDRFGRRPCLILTAVCLCIGQIIFPFCTSWVSAIIVRLTSLAWAMDGSF